MSPGFGAALLTVFVIATSTAGMVMSAVSPLFEGSGSAWSDDPVAVFDCVVPAVPASTVALTVSVADAPEARVPTVQVGSV
ncbi:hypothetical protein BMS3Bbin02_01198 [bacterium BMS3Bbin02]|nr:hypothetical protein BMS3Bbin02_01198 [bacterium BMS3Bbin02]